MKKRFLLVLGLFCMFSMVSCDSKTTTSEVSVAAEDTVADTTSDDTAQKEAEIEVEDKESEDAFSDIAENSVNEKYTEYVTYVYKDEEIISFRLPNDCYLFSSDQPIDPDSSDWFKNYISDCNYEKEITDFDVDSSIEHQIMYYTISVYSQSDTNKFLQIDISLNALIGNGLLATNRENTDIMEYIGKIDGIKESWDLNSMTISDQKLYFATSYNGKVNINFYCVDYRQPWDKDEVIEILENCF